MIKKVTLLSLAVPNFIEMMFFSLLGMCDMFILSRVSDEAAGGVGACNQIIFFVFIIFNIVCVGTSVLVSQYIGAKDVQSAQKAIVGSFVVLFLIGIAGSAVLLFFGGGMLGLIGVSSNLMRYAHIYIKIIGGTIFLQALLNISTIIMRVYGYAKESLYITAGMNIFNIIFTALFVFTFNMGVAGAAIATVMSRGIALAVAVAFLWKHIMEKDSLVYLRKFPRKIMIDLMKIGLPSALENISYHASQLVLTGIILHNFGDSAYIAHAYSLQILFIFLNLTLSIGQGNQIIVGRLVGEGNYEQAYHTCIKNFKIAFLISIGMGATLFFFGGTFVSVFTSDAEILRLSALLFMVDAFLELGRTINVVIINALKGSGDVIFPVIMAGIFMWGVSALGAYIFGVALDFGLPGIWAAMALDEWFRGFIMLLRWRGRKWTTKSLVEQKPAIETDAPDMPAAGSA